MKLDRYLAKQAGRGRKAALRLIASGRVTVDGALVTNGHFPIDRFSRIDLDGEPLAAPDRSLYLMIHKPVGILSATTDSQHRTVLDLIDHPRKDTLHIAGRLDRSSSGLVLLTNDGRWSKELTLAHCQVAKVYFVETREPIGDDAVEAFARGFYFHTEDITTLPAKLEILTERTARVTLHEGRYHQIKRMFHRVNNRVVSLHRERIGQIVLPDDLAPGAWRELTKEEVGQASCLTI